MASSGGYWFATTMMTRSGSKRKVFAKAGETSIQAVRRAKKDGLKGRKLRKAKL